jgi:hypothetical protein
MTRKQIVIGLLCVVLLLSSAIFYVSTQGRAEPQRYKTIEFSVFAAESGISFPMRFELFKKQVTSYGFTFTSGGNGSFEHPELANCGNGAQLICAAAIKGSTVETWFYVSFQDGDWYVIGKAE